MALGGSSVYLLRTNENVTFLTFPDDFFDFWLLLRVSLVGLGGSSLYLSSTNENVTFSTFLGDFLTFGCFVQTSHQFNHSEHYLLLQVMIRVITSPIQLVLVLVLALAMALELALLVCVVCVCVCVCVRVMMLVLVPLMMAPLTTMLCLLISVWL